jgi:hypothetical protein
VDDVVKLQHLSEIIEQHENVDEGESESEDAQTAQVGEVPSQKEACRKCFTYLVTQEEPQIWMLLIHQDVIMVYFDHEYGLSHHRFLGLLAIVEQIEEVTLVHLEALFGH